MDLSLENRTFAYFVSSYFANPLFFLNILFLLFFDKNLTFIYALHIFCIYKIEVNIMFENLNQQIQERKLLRDQKIEEIASSDLDSVVNFRVSDALKEFSLICKKNQSSASSELKRYMLQVVKRGSI